MVSLYKSLNRYVIGIQVVLTKKNDKKTAKRIFYALLEKGSGSGVAFPDQAWKDL